MDYTRVLTDIANGVTQSPTDKVWDKFFQVFLTFLGAWLGFWFATAGDRRKKKRETIGDFLREMSLFMLDYNDIVQAINNYNGLINNQDIISHVKSTPYDIKKSHADNADTLLRTRRIAQDALSEIRKTSVNIFRDEPGHYSPIMVLLERLISIVDFLTDYELIMRMGKRLNGEATRLSFFIPRNLKLMFDALVSALWMHSRTRLNEFIVVYFRIGIIEFIKAITKALDRKSNPVFNDPFPAMVELPPGSRLKPGDWCRIPETGMIFEVRHIVNLDLGNFAGWGLFRAISWNIRGFKDGDILLDWVSKNQRKTWTQRRFRPESLVPVARPKED